MSKKRVLVKSYEAFVKPDQYWKHNQIYLTTTCNLRFTGTITENNNEICFKGKI